MGRGGKTKPRQPRNKLTKICSVRHYSGVSEQLINTPMMNMREIINILTESQMPVESTIPTKPVKFSYHVGTLELTSKEMNSYEGSGISITNRPDAWVKIARIAGRPLWIAEKTSGTFIDNKALDEGHRHLMTEWALERGLVEPAPGSKYGVTLSATMKDRMMVPNATDAYLPGLVAVAYAEDALGIDGVWWTVATRGLNAPRGVIVPSKIPTWKWTKLADDWPVINPTRLGGYDWSIPKKPG